MFKKIKVWGRLSSSNVKKVMWLADELKLAAERIDAGRQYGVVDTPAYKALNPNSKVPTIEDGDFVLWESNSIMRYLCMKYGGEALYPVDAATRADIDRWLLNPFLSGRPESPALSAWIARIRPRHGFQTYVDVPLE